MEVFLPLETGSGQTIDPEVIKGIINGLADCFGGATAFTRSPADALWKQGSSVEKDRIVIIEVMVREVDDAWWSDYRRRLEEEFEQDEVMIRVTPCRII